MFTEKTSFSSLKLSASLENLVSLTSVNNSKETVACNVRMPCKNGKHHYSITQNKIMYLEETVNFHKTDAQLNPENSNYYEEFPMSAEKMPFIDNSIKHECDDIAWQSETAKRTMHKIEATNVVKTVKKKLCDIKTALLIDNLSNVEESTSDLPPIETRWKSEEHIPGLQPLNTSLSVSAPHSFCLASRLKTKKYHQFNDCEATIKRNNRTNKNEISGKVKNLKMNFEAKTKR